MTDIMTSETHKMIKRFENLVMDVDMMRVLRRKLDRLSEGRQKYAVNNQEDRVEFLDLAILKTKDAMLTIASRVL
jgi:hypothetical protein